MADTGGIPELLYAHPDGRPRTRLEMDQWLRSEVPKVHWLRIIAARVFSLPKQVSWDMREIVLKHWLLDEMIRRQVITGDQIGVNANSSNDEGELRQFTQRLANFIQLGQAVSPQNAEGVDMSGYQPPPPPHMGGQPPAPPNGQYAGPPGPPPPPPPPQGPPQGYAQPPQPQQQYAPPMPPQQQYQQPPAPPMMAPPGYAPPPPAGPQMQGPPMGPPPGVPQGAPPQHPAATTTGRSRRTKEQVAAAGGPPAPPQQQQLPMSPPPGAPQGFIPAPQPGMAPPLPQQPFAPAPAPSPVQAPQYAAPPVSANLGALETQVAALTALVQELLRKQKLDSMLLTIVARAIYQKQGSGDAAAFLTELGMPLPQ